jgi:Ca2+-binding RTX toxin-like protein
VFDDIFPTISAAPTLILQSGSGQDSIHLQDVNALIYVGPGDDEVTLAGGVVKVDLADGNDFLDASQSTSSGDGLVGYGGSGNDTLFGTSGADFLVGGRGIDSLAGGAGVDILYGGQQEDMLFGGAGDDMVFGGRNLASFPQSGEVSFEDFTDVASDTLFGGLGSDTLSLDQDDVASGGAGADHFKVYFDPLRESPARIDDFDPNVDSLEINIRMTDELMARWNGQLIAHGVFTVDTEVQWLRPDPTSSTYVLEIGGLSVAEVTCSTMPSAETVKIFGFFGN